MSNESGITPIQYQVLVKVNEVEEKTAGGIYIPEQTKEKDDHASDEGVLVDVAAAAFKFDANAEASAPDVGAHVVFARFAGKRVKGNDGIEYRLMNDQDVIAVRA